MTEGGFARTYGVHLLCRSRPQIDATRLITSINHFLPAASLVGTDSAGPVLIHHPDHLVQLADATIPAQTVVLVSDRPPSGSLLDAALEQSWKFPNAREVVADCRASVMVTDLMSSGLEHQKRIWLVQQVLRATLPLVDCLAMHWVPTQQLLPPNEFLRAFTEGKAELFFAGACNVRLFNITGTDGHRLMDTLGLAALGLPDLQCHFRGLEASAVAKLLYNTALYVFEHGDVIENSHTVEGLEKGSKWRCRHEMAILAPERVVLDLNPGPPFAAGDRT